MLIYDTQNLVKVYPGQSQPVNDRITLQIHEGEIFGILGDNGAVKNLAVLALFVVPVFLPASRLPEIVQTIGYLSPATYAASALKQTLLKPMTPCIGIDLVTLTGFSVLTLWLVSRKLK
ncbi:MAG TPA: hypothetical protein V6C78_34215 [Crinalium sp.]|jgi:hypothetical protein